MQFFTLVQKVVRVMVLVSVLATIGVGCGRESQLDEYTLPAYQGEPLSIKIPVGGEKGVTYKFVPPSKPGDLGDPGDVDRGPESFAPDLDGTFWISDSVASRLVHVDRRGEVTQVIDLKGHLRGVADDIAVTRDKVYVFDCTETAGLVVVNKKTRQVEAEYELTELPRWALVAMWTTQADEVVIQAGGTAKDSPFGDQVYLVIDQKGQHTSKILDSTNVVGLTVSEQGPVVKNYPYNVGEFEAGLHRGQVYTDTIEWRGATITGKRTEEGGFRIERVLPNGDLLVLLTLSVDGPQIDVDEVLQHYRKDGTLVGQARIPIRDNVLRIPIHDHKTTADGRVFTMINHTDHLEIRELRFSKDPQVSLRSILPSVIAMCANALSVSSTGTLV